MKLLQILMLAAFLLVSVVSVYGQRCGDFLWVSLNDKQGKDIDPSKYKNVKIYTKASDVNNLNKINEFEIKPEFKKLNDGKEVISVRTVCGLIEARFYLEYEDKHMAIIISNLPGDSGNIILKDLQFSDGKYEIDLGGRKLNNCQLEHESIVSGSRLIEEELWKINNNNFTVTKGLDKAEPLVIGESFIIDSKVLGEKRRINVYSPSIYLESPNTKLPVLYMPDGGIAEDFLHVAGLVQVSVGNQTMRPFLLVGVENTERRRDMTGTTENEEDKKIAVRVGGSENFRKFLKTELMPQIKERYPTTNETAIIGESLAGLFVMETFFLEPDLFDTYIALDPSLWWNNQRLVKMADKQLQVQFKSKKNLYFASSDEKGIANLTDQLAEILNKQSSFTLRWYYEKMPEEKHSTIYHPAALKAFRMFFKPVIESKP